MCVESKENSDVTHSWFQGATRGVDCSSSGRPDPDRWVPDTPCDNLTIVGRLINFQFRFETHMDDKTTIGSLKKEVALKHEFDASNSVLVFHGLPLYDEELNLVSFGACQA